MVQDLLMRTLGLSRLELRVVPIEGVAVEGFPRLGPLMGPGPIKGFQPPSVSAAVGPGAEDRQGAPQ